MPTISQLPAAEAVTASDQIPLSQDGVSRSTSVGSLLADVQPAIILENSKLLGRTSLGSGGPEGIAVGSGLILENGTLDAAGGLLNSFDTADAVFPHDRLVVRREGRLAAVPMAAVRSLYSAGQHVTIDGTGAIAAVWPTAEELGWANPGDVASLPRSQSLNATDLIPIHREGVSQATTYANLLNAQTIDQASAATAATDSDLVWVAQSGNTMSRQSFSAIWSWITGKLPSARFECVEIDVDTTLDATTHNGRVLVCTRPVRILMALQNMGGGFSCELINLAPAPVTFGPGFVTPPGAISLPPRHSAEIRVLPLSSGDVVYANVHGGGTSATVPSAVQNLGISNVANESLRLSWVGPTVGTPPFTYSILYRVTGTQEWAAGPTDLSAAASIVSGLIPGTPYEFVVVAANAAGAGNISNVVAVTTQGVASGPGQPTELSAATQGPSSIALTWNPPTAGGVVTGYTVQFRSVGSTLWSNGPTDFNATAVIVDELSAATAYEFRVFATNSGGAGPASLTSVATTQPTSGLVTSIQWNLVPVGPYTHGSGSIGINALVTPGDGSIRFGFSTSQAAPPTTWTLAVHVMTNLWGAYVDTPATAGTWYAWAQGTDGSASTVYPTPFTVQ